jgi:quercetin dioxygenase-like cupin family protein
MTLTSLETLAPGRTLPAAALRRWVDALAARPSQWEHAVAHDTGGRHFASLYRDRHIDVWLLCWNVTDDTGWHDHDLSSGAVAVTRGVVQEARLRVGSRPQVRRVAAGRSFAFGPERIHRVSGAVDGSVSIHAYSPPLVRMGQYSMSPSGILRRVSVGYSEELRPD